MLNSLFGATASRYFRWYSQDLAEGITLTGQAIIKYTEKHLNDYMNKIMKTKDEDYVCISDTDSNYLNFDPLVKKLKLENKTRDEITSIIDRICKEKFEPKLKEIYEILADYMQVFENTMNADREAIADKIIITGKKHYIMNVLDMEGVRYQEPYLKMMGIEAVRSSTPQSCRDAIKEGLKVIMEENEEATQKFIADFKAKFFNMTPEEISFPRGVNDMEKWMSKAPGGYILKTPIAVKASIIYNNLLDKLDLISYNRINSGDKIKFCYLKIPNTLKERVIAFDEKLPEEFGVHQFVEYELMFEKAFLDPMKSILEACNWQAEKVVTLEDLFL